MLRALAIWILIIFAESVHGAVRTLFIEPVVGDLKARQVGVFFGMILIFLITFWSIRWMGMRKTSHLLQAGLLWVVLTVLFEIVLGTLVFDYGAERITEDYDPRFGGLMLFGLAFMLFAPLIAGRIRDVDAKRPKA